MQVEQCTVIVVMQFSKALRIEWKNSRNTLHNKPKRLWSKSLIFFSKQLCLHLLLLILASLCFPLCNKSTVSLLFTPFNFLLLLLFLLKVIHFCRLAWMCIYNNLCRAVFTRSRKFTYTCQEHVYHGFLQFCYRMSGNHTTLSQI